MFNAFHATGECNIAVPDDTCLTISSAVTVRPRVYEVAFSCRADAQDAQVRWRAQRHTAPGTGTLITPAPLDLAANAFQGTVHHDHTVEPTYTANLFLLDFTVNLRNTWRWVALQGGELILPASASAGVGFYPAHASSTVLVSAMAHFRE